MHDVCMDVFFSQSPVSSFGLSSSFVSLHAMQMHIYAHVFGLVLKA